MGGPNFGGHDAVVGEVADLANGAIRARPRHYAGRCPSPFAAMMPMPVFRRDRKPKWGKKDVGKADRSAGPVPNWGQVQSHRPPACFVAGTKVLGLQPQR